MTSKQIVKLTLLFITLFNAIFFSKASSKELNNVIKSFCLEGFKKEMVTNEKTYNNEEYN